MKNQIDLRKNFAESDKICAYMKIGYRAIDDWNELMPVVQKIADDILGLHDGSYCDADTLYEHDFVNLLYKDVPYVRNIVCNTIDWLHKQTRTEVQMNRSKMEIERMIGALNLEKTIMRMKHEILSDIADGRIPADIMHFGDLHDYVDANEYGGFCEDGNRVINALPADQQIDVLNYCQDVIDFWLKSPNWFIK